MSVNPSAIGQNKGLSELWKRLRFVFMAVIIYRIGTHIPIPGIDPDKLANIFQQNQGTLLDLFNMFSGGALERMSIMALNIMPYITASIIMSLLEGTTPKTKMTKKDQQIIQALGNSNSELVESGSDTLGKTNVVVIPELTQELIDSKAFDFLHHYSYSWKKIKLNK